MLKILNILLGTISLLLGIIGIFIPGLPTTPFLLLSATLYVRSSPKLHAWLINHKYLGKYIRKYRKQGLNSKTLAYALSLMWGMVIVSTVFFIELLWLKITLISIALIGTITMFLIHKRKN